MLVVIILCMQLAGGYVEVREKLYNLINKTDTPLTLAC